MTNTPRRAFDTVEELAADRGLIGLALSNVESWILREADRRDADRWEDAWKFLLGIPNTSTQLQLLFRVASGQREAIRRFSRIAQGTGSINASQYDRLRKACASGNRRVAIDASRKIFSGMYRTDRGHYLLSRTTHRPDLESAVKAMISDAYDRDVRRLGRRLADEPPKRLTIHDCRTDSINNKISFAMTFEWLRNRNGFPGLCFCSDTVITVLLAHRFNLRNLDIGTIRKVRRHLGLEKATVLVRRITSLPGGEFVLADSRDNLIWSGKVT